LVGAASPTARTDKEIRLMAETGTTNVVSSAPRTSVPRKGQAREVDARAAFVNGGGLCLTCNNARHCYYLASRGPALFCELFDDRTDAALRSRGPAAGPSVESSETFRPAEDPAAKYAGLCVNCKHRTTCTHPRPTGGVWHCEDYE
jgi:hypothetical protein